MSRGKYNTHTRKFRVCPSCDEKKSVDEYREGYQTIKGTKYTRYRGKCKSCRDIVSIEDVRVPRIDPNVKKFCHNCWKWKVLSKYRYYKTKKSWEHSNNCKECEKVIGRKSNVIPFENYSEVVVDYSNTEYYCGFIGKTPYKEICKVFNIRYEK